MAQEQVGGWPFHQSMLKCRDMRLGCAEFTVPAKTKGQAISFVAVLRADHADHLRTGMNSTMKAFS